MNSNNMNSNNMNSNNMISNNMNSNNNIDIDKETNLLSYIEEIQKKFISQIEDLNLQIEDLNLQKEDLNLQKEDLNLQKEDLNLKNESLISKNRRLNNDLELSNKERKDNYNKLLDTQECLKIQIETNKNILKIIKENEKQNASRFFNYFNY